MRVTRADQRRAPRRRPAAGACRSIRRRRSRSPAWSSSPLVSFALLGGSLPALPGTGNAGNGGPIRTPTPSNVVVVADPRADIPGSFLYVKGGNIWSQSGDQVTPADGRRPGDAMPAWSPDGASIYFVRTTQETGPLAVRRRDPRRTTCRSRRLLRIDADGSGEPEVLLTGRVRSGANTWSYFIREPSISPDGTPAAIITDGPDPTSSDLVVKLLDLGDADAHGPGPARDAGTRPPGPGVVARRPVRPVRAQRARGRARDAGDPPLHRRQRAGPGP